jgi:hypothetical protein
MYEGSGTKNEAIGTLPKTSSDGGPYRSDCLCFPEVQSLGRRIDFGEAKARLTQYGLNALED